MRTRPILEEIIGGRMIDEKFLKPIQGRPAAYLVHRPSDRSFSVISMVWSPGQKFPVHDHLSWGLIGVYQNSIREERYERLDDGSREGYAEIRQIGDRTYQSGEILEEGLVFDEHRRNDLHRILNLTPKPSVSIHILAADLGMKHRNQYDPASKTVRRFVSGYDDPDGRLEGRVVAGDADTGLTFAKPQLVLDARGLSCPHPTLQTVGKLQGMAVGEVLEVLTDSEDSAYDELPERLKSEGHQFVALEFPDGYWKVRVRK